MKNITQDFTKVKHPSTMSTWWVLQVTEDVMLCFCQVKLANKNRVAYPYGLKTKEDKMLPLGTASSQGEARIELQKYFNANFDLAESE
jgi:hypothetical protein